jgi:hypothetical protein
MEFRIFPMGFGAPPAPRPAPRPSTPIVTQSLGSWTEQREKGLGWRCDAVECLVATPVPDPSTEDDMDGDGDVSSDMPAEDKEMLSIYSATQHSPIPAPEPGQDPNAGVDANSEFVILACKDRWHRTCLETAERSAGHCTTSDKDGREWVRCPKCRKDGWVVPRSQPVTPPEPAEPATA